MPIYEYTCENCEARFEQLVRTMNSAAEVHCPKCGSAKTAREMSVFAVGAEGAGKARGDAPPPGLCGGCGGPGPWGAG